MLNAILVTAFVIAFGITVMVLDRFVIKSKPQKGWIPDCLVHKVPMVSIHPTNPVPDKIKHYLATYNFPLNVVRKFVCQKCGRELWIAPQVEDMKKPLFVQQYSK